MKLLHSNNSIHIKSLLSVLQMLHLTVIDNNRVAGKMWCFDL